MRRFLTVCAELRSAFRTDALNITALINAELVHCDITSHEVHIYSQHIMRPGFAKATLE
tara:strand:+ start:282 stop:458 length:177 start_codon:yes stop_codon:yes gene_type:complete